MRAKITPRTTPPSMAGMGETFFIIIIMSKTGTDNNQGVMWKLLSRPFFIKPVSMAVSVFN